MMLLGTTSIWGFIFPSPALSPLKTPKPLREVVRKVPLDQMFVETDSPYLTPVPHRGKRNEPAYVRFVAETVASVKGLNIEEVASVTTNNVRALFRI